MDWYWTNSQEKQIMDYELQELRDDKARSDAQAQEDELKRIKELDCDE